MANDKPVHVNGLAIRECYHCGDSAVEGVVITATDEKSVLLGTAFYCRPCVESGKAVLSIDHSGVGTPWRT